MSLVTLQQPFIEPDDGTATADGVNDSILYQSKTKQCIHNSINRNNALNLQKLRKDTISYHLRNYMKIQYTIPTQEQCKQEMEKLKKINENKKYFEKKSNL